MVKEVPFCSSRCVPFYGEVSEGVNITMEEGVVLPAKMSLLETLGECLEEQASEEQASPNKTSVLR